MGLLDLSGLGRIGGNLVKLVRVLLDLAGEGGIGRLSLSEGSGGGVASVAAGEQKDRSEPSAVGKQHSKTYFPVGRVAEDMVMIGMRYVCVEWVV